MGIKESNEWLQDLIIEVFEEVSGIRSGVESDTLVYSQNASYLWMFVCQRLKINAKFVSNLHTIEDYVQEFAGILRKRNVQRMEFLKELQNFIFTKFGIFVLPNEIIYQNFLPKSEDKNQYLREEMFYFAKMLKLKIAVKNHYQCFDKDFSSAQTLSQITDVVFGKEFTIS